MLQKKLENVNELLAKAPLKGGFVVFVAIFKHFLSSVVVEIQNNIDRFRVSPTINCTLQWHIPISILCQQFPHQVVPSKKRKFFLQNDFFILARRQCMHHSVSCVDVTLREHISRNIY